MLKVVTHWLFLSLRRNEPRERSSEPLRRCLTLAMIKIIIITMMMMMKSNLLIKDHDLFWVPSKVFKSILTQLELIERSGHV